MFQVPDTPLAATWRDNLQLNTIKDTFKQDGSEYQDSDIIDEFARKYQEYGETIRVKFTFHKKSTITRTWNRIVDAIPDYIARTARGDMAIPTHIYPEHVIAMMNQTGWGVGEGLGLRQGRSQPVIPPTRDHVSHRTMAIGGERNTSDPVPLNTPVAFVPAQGFNASHTPATRADVKRKVPVYALIEGEHIHYDK